MVTLYHLSNFKIHVVISYKPQYLKDYLSHIVDYDLYTI